MQEPAKAPIRIFLAEPSTLLRSGIKRLLQDEIGFQVVGEAGSSIEYTARCRELRPDVILLDAGLCHLNSDVFGTLTLIPGHAKVLLFGDTLDPVQLQVALQRGARGAIGKQATVDVLIKSVRAVAAGEYWFDRATLVGATKKKIASCRPTGPSLTAREMDVVAEIVASSSNAQIALKLHISEETVKRHLANIYAKLGVSNRLELAMFAVNRSGTQIAIA